MPVAGKIHRRRRRCGQPEKACGEGLHPARVRIHGGVWWDGKRGERGVGGLCRFYCKIKHEWEAFEKLPLHIKISRWFMQVRKVDLSEGVY